LFMATDGGTLVEGFVSTGCDAFVSGCSTSGLMGGTWMVVLAAAWDGGGVVGGWGSGGVDAAYRSPTVDADDASVPGGGSFADLPAGGSELAEEAGPYKSSLGGAGVLAATGGDGAVGSGSVVEVNSLVGLVIGVSRFVSEVAGFGESLPAESALELFADELLGGEPVVRGPVYSIFSQQPAQGNSRRQNAAAKNRLR
jgi:hypothetical protein